MINHLVVDAQLVIDVAQALGHNPQTQNERIQVNVQAGIPQTRGIVNMIQTAGSKLDADEECR